MSADDSTPEDIAGLFRKFGGDANGYKEFAPPEDETEAPRVWPLLSGQKIVHPPAAAAPAPAPPPRSEPVLHTPPPALAPVAPPIAPPVTPAVDSTGAALTPLEQLFARLAGSQPPAAASGPMSRWRRPT
ncbi:hypothetical protein NWF24_13420 [Variovorax paradoxus]|uniref:BcsR/BcsP family cellulose biosynthesis protein n=1 Tax=Variovorax paradoxus TaxID=34073 RepID=UPI0021AC195D|nr:BcsR/BcsP family cellulose biosynthesis protein [Variovorax paradoxus]UVH60363.1 hypothetical protein NWF24_13420 [Variovorax paradoxus]